MPFVTVTGNVYDSGDYRRSLDIAREHVNLPAIRARQAVAAGDSLIGVGFANYIEMSAHGTALFSRRGLIESAQAVNDFPQPQLAALMAAGGLVAFLACDRSLAAAARREPDFALSIFDVCEIEIFEPEELFLTDTDRWIIMMGIDYNVAAQKMGR
jgi:hypothetical protein